IALAFVAAAGTRLRKVGRVREMMAGGSSFEEAAAAVRHPPFFLDRLRAQVAAWGGGAGPLPALESLRSLERGLKSGGPPRALVERLLVQAAGAPREAAAPRRAGGGGAR